MAVSAKAIRTAISEALEGRLGAIPVTGGRFQRGVFDGQSQATVQATTLQEDIAKHWFDVRLRRLVNNGASPVSAIGSRRIANMDVAIRIATRTRTVVQQDERDDVLHDIITDAEDAIQLLGTPNVLDETEDGDPTHIVSGMLLGPGGEGDPAFDIVNEDWKAQVIVSEITGRIVLDITANT